MSRDSNCLVFQTRFRYNPQSSLNPCFIYMCGSHLEWRRRCDGDTIGDLFQNSKHAYLTYSSLHLPVTLTRYLPSRIIISMPNQEQQWCRDWWVETRHKKAWMNKGGLKKELLRCMCHKTSVWGRCLLCREALKSGSAEANQSWRAYARWVFIIVGFISMPVRSSVALITWSPATGVRPRGRA